MGYELGESDGASLGETLGTEDGSTVGTRLGCSTGTEVGKGSVGATVGSCVNLFTIVSTTVVIKVGRVLGTSLGILVGEVPWSLVGWADSVGPPQNSVGADEGLCGQYE